MSNVFDSIDNDYVGRITDITAAVNFKSINEALVELIEGDGRGHTKKELVEWAELQLLTAIRADGLESVAALEALFQLGFHNAHVQKPSHADVWALQTAYNMLADRLGIRPNPPFTRYLKA